MPKHTYTFSRSSTDYYPEAGFAQLKKITDPQRTVLLTDENIFRAQKTRFRGWNTIVLKPGEEYKVQSTADAVIGQLIDMEAGRDCCLVGVGGGVVTDLAGYIASVYLRGIRVGFVPTSLLGMVDASIGGKNGIDAGVYKNMVGTIRQPDFILHDMTFLKSLPPAEWTNGFAEIIKHACIKDAPMFRELERNDPSVYRGKNEMISRLVRRNAELKTRVVQQDEFEKGPRRLLNFGHTLGHAIENQYEITHGQAVAVGMVFACRLSEKITGFRQTAKLAGLLEKYGLPAYAGFNKQKVFNVLRKDKKRVRREIHFVLLDKIGKAVIRPIPLKQLEKFIGES